ncbi:MAG: DUF6348 family protein [Propionibacteriaceae bacterium]|jgi:hypothetical protein|nr:DUF6348 family protein [Propionibacteriaceae bacterium]
MEVRNCILDNQPEYVDASTRVEIRQRLADVFSNGQLIDNSVILPKSQVTMKASLIDTGSTGRATVMLWFSHPSWDRTVFESATGIGETEKEALDRAIMSIALTLVFLLDNLGTSIPDERFATQWDDCEHQWSLWCGLISSHGSSELVPVEGSTYLGLLKDSIMEHLENQIISYLQISAEWFNEEPNAEVLFNGMVNPEMSLLVESHMRASWPPHVEVSHKQLIWISQEEG